MSPIRWIILIAICVVAFFLAVLPMTACVLFVLSPFFEINKTTGNIALVIAAVLLIVAIVRGILS